MTQNHPQDPPRTARLRLDGRELAKLMPRLERASMAMVTVEDQALGLSQDLSRIRTELSAIRWALVEALRPVAEAEAEAQLDDDEADGTIGPGDNKAGARSWAATDADRILAEALRRAQAVEAEADGEASDSEPVREDPAPSAPSRREVQDRVFGLGAIG